MPENEIVVEDRSDNNLLRDTVDCDAVLVPDYTYWGENKKVYLSWLSTVTSSNYAKAKESANALAFGYGVLFEGEWNSFKEKRAALFKEEQFESTVIESRQLIMYRISDAALSQWGRCVEAKLGQAKLAVWVHHPGDDGATVTVSYRSATGIPRLRDVEVTVGPNGKLFCPKSKRFVSSCNIGDLDGSYSLDLQRDDKAARVRGWVNSVGGDGGRFSADFLLPEAPPPPIILTPETVALKGTDYYHGVNIGTNPAYGPDTIINTVASGSARNEAHYNVRIKAHATYRLIVTYASPDDRTVTFTLSRKGSSQQVFHANRLSGGTGGHDLFVERNVEQLVLGAGDYILELLRPGGAFPHIRRIVFEPLK
jgi:hypothetical protein